MRHLRSVPPPREPPAVANAALSKDEIASLLERTSRTFALTIPLLEEPLATDVGLAYLLFRIADTLEDAPTWDRDARLLALDSFGEWLLGDEDEHAWQSAVARMPPTSDDGCLALLARAEGVRASVMERGEELATAITMDVVRTSSKMAEFVATQSAKGGLVLETLPELKEYCYAVAGIVGELLTEMFLVREPSLEPARDRLMDLAPAFGEALQLVNILKDAKDDAHEGRTYLPPQVDRAEVVRLARSDLERADEYLGILAEAGAPPRLRAFCELPIRLAAATLDCLDRGVAKLSREEVTKIFLNVSADLR